MDGIAEVRRKGLLADVRFEYVRRREDKIWLGGASRLDLNGKTKPLPTQI